MNLTDVQDALPATARLETLDRAAAPALLIGADGAVAWANVAGRALGAGDRLDPQSARAVAGLGAAGLLRLRLGAAGRFEPQAFRGERIGTEDAPFVLLEALAAPARNGWTARPARPSTALDEAPIAAEPAAAAEIPAGDPFENEAPARDAAADPLSDQVGARVDTVGMSTAAPVDAALLADSPPDPRQDLSFPSDTDKAIAKQDVAAADAPGPEAAASPPSSPRALRFVFEIDGDQRISFLSPDLAETVGDSARQAVGRAWVDVANDLSLDPAGAVARALGGRGGWSGLLVDWPTPTGGRLPLTLSALPVFDRGRTFVGFRGLGAEINPQPAGDAEPEPATTAPELVAIAEPGDPEALTTASTAEAGPIPANANEPLSFEPEAPDGADAPPPVERYEPPVLVSTAAERQEAFAGNVVPLREAPVPERTADLAQPALSRVEESAFDEIARRLTGAGETIAEAPSPRDVWEDIAADAEIALGSDGPSSKDGPDAPSAEDLRRLLDRLGVGALVLKGGEAIYANRAALEMSGHEDLEGLRARGGEALFAEPLRRDDAAPCAVRLIAEDGVEVDVEARLSPIEWGGAFATLVALRRAEGATAALTAAHEREKELAAILDTATDGVLTLDGAGRVLSINRSAEALFGYEAREIIGSLFSLALAPESRRVAFEYLDGLKANGVAALLNDGREVLGLVRQGGAIPLYMTIGRVGSADDSRYCAVLRDITHWKKVEEELVAAKRQAERASAQKSEFLAKVSHEIRTPLNAIIGFAEVMMEERFGAVGNERYKDYLKDIHLSGGHIVSLVNDLLDLSKIESGKLELAFVDVDLNETVAQAVALLQPQANRAHIIIRTSLARSLPQVQADQRSIRQIVLNLASNAVKFTQGGGQVIVATALNDLGEPVIRVRDTGVGMSRREVEQALEPFRQLPIGGGDGAGLGLPLTKALAEANHARFQIQSAVGEGTLVEVTFSALGATG